MITVLPTLRNPPIVEAVLDIECDFESGFALTKIEAASRDALRSTYPKLQTQFLQEFKLEARADGTASAEQPLNSTIQAFQFRDASERQIVQFRTGGYSFNRLTPYSSFDDYIFEIRRTWGIYLDIARPVQVRGVQLRYINRIHLPLIDGSVDLDEYFKNGPKLPDDMGLTFAGFLQQNQAIEPNTGFLVNTVLTAQDVKESKLSVIFDNSVKSPKTLDVSDWASIELSLQSLRNLKNRVFINTLTEKCLHLFQ